jgi:two-component system, chemotaxis family, CheB/CheR fusion protein
MAKQHRSPTDGSADPERDNETEISTENASSPLVVGIAASAGGLKAFKELLATLPNDQNIAYVLIQHLAPTHESQLAEILARDTTLTIAEATDGVVIEAGHAYVIPPNQQLYLLHDCLHFMPRPDHDQRFNPADVFFQSLAEDRGAASIGVILSGTGSDGTKGLCSIKSAGGLTFAQTAESTEYDGMPSSAIAAGCADFILAPRAIGQEIARLVTYPRHLYQACGDKTEEILAISKEELGKIFVLLRARTGHDFSYYKANTIKRRINRRMMVHKLERISEYLMLLQKDAEEIDQLYQDILINVTEFFRDPETFEALAEVAFKQIIENRPEGAPIRIWVPGCSSGQEVYSIAIAIHEYLGDRANLFQIQIFGSDIDEDSVDKARAGVYPESIVDQVSQVRLQRYFHRVSSGYQVNKALRDLCIFALQSVTRDPPFSRLDLISCRNLLIYLDNILQKKVLQIFHYALQPQGFLMLGPSESIGSDADLFALKDKKSKLYQKKSVATRFSDDLLFRAQSGQQGKPLAMPAPSEGNLYDMEQEVQSLLLDTYAPPGVVINPDQMVLQFIGRTWPYIEHGSGNASLNLYKITHPDLIVELRAAIHAIGKNGKAIVKENVRLKVDNKEKRVDIRVMALGGTVLAENNMLVMFEARPDIAELAPDQANLPDNAVSLVKELNQRNEELDRELSSTREYMQSIIEEQEGANEELRSANEEIQTTNEELETAKEELQSSNEELATVNEELETRNDELARANDDLTNLLASVNLPILMLGSDLRIRQFTKPAESLLNLIASDLGRPIGNIKPNIELPELEQQALQIIDRMETRTFEAQENSGHWYSVRMRPYKTQDNRIDGVVMTFVEIDSLKDVQRLEENLNRERRLAAVVRDSNDVVTLQDLEGNILAWNPSAEKIYGFTEAEATKMNVRELVFEDDWTKLVEVFTAAGEGRTIMPLELRRRAKDGTVLNIWLVASVLTDTQGKPVALATTEKQL